MIPIDMITPLLVLGAIAVQLLALVYVSVPMLEDERSRSQYGLKDILAMFISVVIALAAITKMSTVYIDVTAIVIAVVSSVLALFTIACVIVRYRFSAR
jgi:hypothetical protein